VKILVVAAWEPELARFRERLAAAREPREVEVVLETLGVGLVEVAISTTQCVARHRPDAALLLGTCGAFAAAGLEVGSVVVAEGVRLTDAGVALGSSALPGPMPAHATFDVALHDALVAAGARSVQIANTVGITIDDELAARLSAGASSDVEHLEAFAFARACAREAVPCAAALAVANAVGSNGRAEWLASHVHASASAADLAYDALGALASALSLRSSTTARSPERA
jgi:nucleoside phosphorylase